MNAKIATPSVDHARAPARAACAGGSAPGPARGWRRGLLVAATALLVGSAAAQSAAPLPMLLVILLLIVAMTVLAAWWNRWKHMHPRRVRAVVLAIGVLMLLRLV